MTPETAWLLLATVPGVGPTRFWRLVSRFGSAEAVLGAPELDLVAIGKCPPDVASAITRAGARERDLLARVEELRGRGIRLAMPLTSESGSTLPLSESGGKPALSPPNGPPHSISAEQPYPALLAGRRAPPPVLFIWGAITEADSRAVAVVGSRRASEAGLDAARAIASQLAGAGVTVVSGLALGIDTAAHESALDSGGPSAGSGLGLNARPEGSPLRFGRGEPRAESRGGRTIAVIGSGIDRIYPPANIGLAQRIADSGAIVSEFTPTAPVSREGLLARNRTIAGLARAVIVVQTRDPGGAVVAAQHAREFGVPALVVVEETWEEDFLRGAEAVRALHATVVSAERAAEEAIASLEREPVSPQPSLL